MWRDPGAHRGLAAGVMLGAVVVVAGCASDLPVAPRVEVSTHLEIPADADSAVLVVRNPGHSPLEWHVVPSALEVTVEPGASVVAGGDSATAIVRVDRARLPIGTVRFSLLVRTSGFRDYPVELVVHVPLIPVLTVTRPATFPFPATDARLRFRNTGNGDLEWEASTDATWLEMDVASGRLANDGSEAWLGLRIDRSATPRDTTALITFRVHGADHATLEIPVGGNPPPVHLAGGARDAVVIGDRFIGRGSRVFHYPAGDEAEEFTLSRPAHRVVWDTDRFVALHDDAVTVIDRWSPTNVEVVELGFRPRSVELIEGPIEGPLAGIFLIPTEADTGVIHTLHASTGEVTSHDLGVPPLLEISGPLVSTAGSMAWWRAWGDSFQAQHPTTPFTFHEDDGRFWNVAGHVILSSGMTAQAPAGDIVPGDPLITEDGVPIVSVRGVVGHHDRLAVLGGTPGTQGTPDIWTFEPFPHNPRLVVPPPLLWAGETVPSTPLALWTAAEFGPVLWLVRRATAGPLEGSLFLSRFWD